MKIFILFTFNFCCENLKQFQGGGMATEKKSALNKELLFLILQFCNDEGYKKTAHM